MVVATSASPWERPRRRKPRHRRKEIERMVNTIRAIGSLGPSDHVRAQFVHALRRLLEKGPWDQPRSAA